MTRSVPEWAGKTDDDVVPPRVRLRIFTRYGGICPLCHRNLRPGHWQLDHRQALGNGGQHREDNLQPVCDNPCHSDKTRDDVAAKAAGYVRRLSNAGIKRSKRPMPGSKASGWKRKMDGTVVKR